MQLVREKVICVFFYIIALDKIFLKFTIISLGQFTVKFSVLKNDLDAVFHQECCIIDNLWLAILEGHID